MCPLVVDLENSVIFSDVNDTVCELCQSCASDSCQVCKKHFEIIYDNRSIYQRLLNYKSLNTNAYI